MLIQVKSHDLFKKHLQSILAHNETTVYIDSKEIHGTRVLTPANQGKPSRHIKVKLLVITTNNSLYYSEMIDRNELTLDEFKENLLNMEAAHGFNFANQNFSINQVNVTLE